MYFISFFFSKCGPRLSAEAAERLRDSYVAMRCGSKEQESISDKKSTIPITVRQLEAIIRISESLAKMQLLPFVNEKHVSEALRLFKVSTLKAASSGDLAGAEGFTSEEDHQELVRVEKQIKRRFSVGSQFTEQTIVQDLVKQNVSERVIHKVLNCLIRRGDIQMRGQKRWLLRLK